MNEIMEEWKIKYRNNGIIEEWNDGRSEGGAAVLLYCGAVVIEFIGFVESTGL